MCHVRVYRAVPVCARHSSVDTVKSKLGLVKKNATGETSAADTTDGSAETPEGGSDEPPADASEELKSGDFGQSDRADRDTYPSRRS